MTEHRITIVVTRSEGGQVIECSVCGLLTVAPLGAVISGQVEDHLLEHGCDMGRVDIKEEPL